MVLEFFNYIQIIVLNVCSRSLNSRSKRIWQFLPVSFSDGYRVQLTPSINGTAKLIDNGNECDVYRCVCYTPESVCVFQRHEHLLFCSSVYHAT
jgi:hypothetical protein